MRNVRCACLLAWAVLLFAPAWAVAKTPAAVRQGDWFVIDTDDFRVCTIVSAGETEQLAAKCAEIKAGLTRRWLADKSATWNPRCSIVLHPTAASYLRATGNQANTAAATSMDFEGDRVVMRRIDLRPDHPEGYADALAHEMTHVVFGERFAHFAVPRWADEGMAVMADSPERQARHFADLHRARRSGRMLRLVELVRIEDYPPAQISTFYGQSAAVVDFLVQRGSHEQFVRFVEHADQHGYDRALIEVYDIQGVAELERAWTAHLDARLARRE